MNERDLPDVWQRAIARARTKHLTALRINDRLYAVKSVSKPGDRHLVSLDEAGHIVDCSECLGWRGRDKPCQHAGSVARRRLRELSQNGGKR